MKKVLSLLISVLFILQCLPIVSSAATVFEDVAEDVYYAGAVAWAVEKGITAGVDATHFGPNRTCTRGQAVSFIWRAKGCPEPVGNENPFTDVKESDYFYKPVLWAVENGITAGMTPTTFGPNKDCTRGQIVTFLWNTEGKQVMSVENPFTDVKESHYFYNAVLWAVEKNITAGMTPTTFGPNLKCTRAQIVCFLERCYKEVTPPAPHEHSFGEWTVTTPATCTDDGVETRECACGEKETRPVAATGHSFGEWAVTTPATCTEDGVETRECACGEKETRPVAATGHSFGEWVVTTPATCTDDGVETRECACGEKETRPVAATGHSFGEWTVAIAPTYTDAGVEMRVCSICGDDEERAIPALVPDAPFSIKKHPADINTGLDETVAFEVEAAGGKPPYSYTWQYKNNSVTGFTNIDGFSNISGADTETLSVKVIATMAGDNYQFRCVVTDADGEKLKSAAAKLNIDYTPITIITQPQSLTCEDGDTVYFNVEATGGVEPYSYQWQYKSKYESEFADITADDYTWIKHYNTNEILVNVYQVSFTQEYKLRCVITDATGATVISDECEYTEYQHLSIKQQPTDIFADPGDSATAEVVAENGLPTYTYQWYFRMDGMPVFAEIGESDIWADGYYSASLNVTPTADLLDSNLRVYCKISDEYGDTVDSDIIYVLRPLKVASQTEFVVANAGDFRTFSVEVSGGKAPYTYRWFMITDIEGSAPVSDFETFDTVYHDFTTYITQEEIDYNAKYYCEITDSAGNVICSEPAKVYDAGAIQPLAITTQPTDTYGDVGDEVSYTVEAAGGISPYSYQWCIVYLDNWDLGPIENETATTSELTLTLTQEHIERGIAVWCNVTDVRGEGISTDLAGVVFPLQIVHQPADATDISVGEVAAFHTLAAGGKAPLSYQWYIEFNGNKVVVDKAGNDIFGAVYSGYNTKNFSVLSSGKAYYEIEFFCVVTDADGNKVKSDSVAIKPEVFTLVDYSRFINFNLGDVLPISVEIDGGVAPYNYTLQARDKDNPEFYDYKSYNSYNTDYHFDQEITAIMIEYNVEFRYVVTDARGKACTTGIIYLKEMDPFVIKGQSVSGMGISVGSKVNLYAEATGGLQPYTYRWVYKNDAMTGESDVFETNSTVFTVDIIENDCQYNGYYKCIITDARGQVIESDPIYFNFALHVRKQTETVSTKVGEKAFFSVTPCGGVAPYRYSWEVYNAKTGRWETVSSAMSGRTTGHSGSIMSFNVASSDCGKFTKFRCYIEDSRGIDVISEEIVLNIPLSILSQPKNAKANDGDRGVLIAGLEVTGGSGSYTYRWRYRNIYSSSTYYYCSDSPDVFYEYDSKALGINEMNYSMYNYYFICMITDSDGNVVYTDPVSISKP